MRTKQLLTKMLLLVAVMLMGAGTAWADADETMTFSEKGYSNGDAVNSGSISGTNFDITFSKGTGSSNPAYYSTGAAVRAYGGNTMTVSSSTKTIEKIELSFGSGDGSNTITTDGGSYSNGTWTGSATSVIFTIGGTTGHRRIASVAVTYKSDSSTPTCVAPTFSPTAGTYTSAQDVTISTTTEGASIYYTTDGTAPTEESTKYTAPISVSEITTIKAIAIADGYDNSVVVTAIYTIILPFTVTLGDDNSTLTETEGGAGVTLPTRSDISDYAFVGWSETNVSTETTAAPTIIPAGDYSPTANITLYPVYAKTGETSTPSAFSVGNTGNFAIVSEAQSGKYYALPTNPTVSSGKITAQEITVSEIDGVKFVTPANASGFTWTIAAATNGYTLSDGSKYIYHSNGGASGTNLTYGTSTSYTWLFTIDGDYVKMAGMSGSTTNSRGLLFSGTTIGGYALSNWASSSYYKTMILPISEGATIYYWSSPVAAAVERPVITVAENPFLFSTTATITCATEGAAIKYSFDGETWYDYSETLTLTETKTIYAKAIKGTDESSVAQVTATKNLAEPTVTINADGITNTNFYNGTDAGSLSASVTYNNEAISGATVVWSGDNDAVATIDENGVVTLVGVGTVTFTATYAGNADYSEKTATYPMTVTYINPNANDGSAEKPFTVAEALEAITNGTFNTNTYYYVTGIISQIDDVNTTQYYNATYHISDDGQTTTQLEVYRGKYLDNTNFTSADQIQLGDEVTVYGKLTYYQSTTPEIASGNYLVKLNRKAVRYYLVGSFDEDPWIDHKIEMTKSGNTYIVEKAFEANTQFKILKIDETNNNETTWYGGATNDEAYGIHSEWYEDIPLTAGDSGKNFKIEAASDDKYTFTVDASDSENLTLTVTGWHVPVVKYYLAGNWSENWSEGKIELTENADGTFSTSKLVGNGTRFKFVKTIDDAETMYGATQTGDDYGIHSAHCTDIALSDASNASAFVIQIAADATLSFKLDVTNMTFDVAGWPITAEGNLFQKVTSNEEFTDGAYLIVYEGNEVGNVAFDGSATTNIDSDGNHIDVTILNNAIVANATTKASLFFIQNGTIKSASGLYIGNTSNSNGMNSSDETVYQNTISIDTDGNAVILSSGGAYLRYNTQDNGRFRYYKSASYENQAAIQLYKLVAATEIPVSITAAGYATYCSENALDFTNVKGLTAYKATISDNKVSFTQVTEVPAEEGVLLKGDKGTYNVPVIASTTADFTDNQFKGVTEEKTIDTNPDNGIFVLMNGKQGVGFYKTTGESFTLSAHSAYLPAMTGATARSFIGFDFDGGTTTAIAQVEDGGLKMEGTVYNLQGQRVESSMFNGQSSMLKKGLYIVNGKKVVMK